MSELTQELLKELLSYNPKTGDLTWKRDQRGPVRKGDIAGWVNKQGYRGICIKGRCYVAHRVAWLYMTGKWPQDHIDHLNHDRLDNRWENLREVSQLANNRNKKPQKNCPLGVHGITKNIKGTKYRVQINVKGKTIFLGTYDSFEKACQVRKDAEKEHGYHANHGSRTPGTPED